MKKSMLLLVMLVISIYGYGQSRIGYSLEEVKREFPNGEKVDDKYHVNTEEYLVSYYFNNNNICYLTIIVPYTLKYMYRMIEYYNKEYIVISENSWKRYISDTKIMYVKLDNVDKWHCFIISVKSLEQ